MTPEDAARGIDLFNQVRNIPAVPWGSNDYRPLTDFSVFQNIRVN
jgi:hypothetical protein